MFDPTRVTAYPEQPGVYLMKDVLGTVVYVGKAKNLRVRLKQYFSLHGDGRYQIPLMLEKLHDIETIVVASEKDALLLEARLIRRFKPKYNVLMKDDRSMPMIRIGMEHRLPRIEYVRSKDIADLPPQAFGPFPHIKEIFDIAVRLFKIRQCSDTEFQRRMVPCILYQIGKCSAPCVMKISEEEYRHALHAATSFLSGDLASSRQELMKQMGEASDKLEFEKAHVLYEAVRYLEEVESERSTDRIEEVESADVIGVWRESTTKLALTIAHYRDHFLQYSEGWLFDIEDELSSAEEVASSLILQLYQQRSDTPGMLLLPELFRPIVHIVHEALSDIFQTSIDVTCPIRGRKAELVRLASENAKARLLQDKHAKDLLLESLAEIEKVLELSSFPRVIDCFDASHFGGKGKVSACVSFQEGLPNKRRYRTFKAASCQTANDLALLGEAVIRRYKRDKEGDPLPDLILVDGGRTQLQAVLKALSQLGVEDVDVVAITKEKGRHDKGMTREKIFVRGRSEPVVFLPDSPLLHFLQRVRDEAHRFSIEFQKKQRKRDVRKSVLDGILGIGPKKKARLLRAFSGIDEIASCSAEEVAQRAGISLKDARAVIATISTKKW